jgi:lipid A 3-O-deacylase
MERAAAQPAAFFLTGHAGCWISLKEKARTQLMQIRTLFSLALALLISASATYAQGTAPTAVKEAPPATARGAWELGPFANGGVGVGDRSSFSFFWAGVHVGKVLSPPAGPGFLKGQFEFAGELVPFWQSYTPAPHIQTVSYKTPDGVIHYDQVPYGGGTYTGLYVVPVIFRWNFKGTKKVVPFVQAAGGLIWTNHKYPPDYLVPHGLPGGTCVWNFTPQGGIGMHYFIAPKRSVSLGVNAVHISSASLGDRNPGVNASVQFQLGYNWWK